MDSIRKFLADNAGWIGVTSILIASVAIASYQFTKISPEVGWFVAVIAVTGVAVVRSAIATVGIYDSINGGSKRWLWLGLIGNLAISVGEIFVLKALNTPPLTAFIMGVLGLGIFFVELRFCIMTVASEVKIKTETLPASKRKKLKKGKKLDEAAHIAALVKKKMEEDPNYIAFMESKNGSPAPLEVELEAETI